MSSDLLKNHWPVRTPAARQSFAFLALEQIKAYLGPKIPPRFSKKWDALGREQDPDLLYSGMLHLGRELSSEWEEGALRIFHSLASEASVPEELRRQAQKELQAISGQGAVGGRAEHLTSRFFRDATDYKTILPMLLGSAVGGVVKSISSLRLANFSGVGRKFLPSLLGFAAEASAFAMAGRALHHLAGDPVRENVGEDLASAGITLGAMKLFHWAGSKVPIPYASQPATFLGLYSAHHIEQGLGLRPKADGATTITDILAAMVSLGVGSHLGQRLLGAGWRRLQRELELRSSLAQEHARAQPKFLEIPGGFASTWAQLGALSAITLTPGIGLAATDVGSTMVSQGLLPGVLTALGLGTLGVLGMTYQGKGNKAILQELDDHLLSLQVNNPEDPAILDLWAVIADRLIEQGDIRGEWICLELILAKLLKKDPSNELKIVETRIEEIRLECQRIIRGRFNHVFQNKLPISFKVPTGFSIKLDRILMDLPDNLDPFLREFFGDDCSAWVRELEILNRRITSDDLRWIISEPTLSRLTSLNLKGSRLDIETWILFRGFDEVAGLIASAHNLRHLTSLNLSRNSLHAEGARAIAETQYLKNLTVLFLGDEIGDAGAKTIEDSPNLPRLKFLNGREIKRSQNSPTGTGDGSGTGMLLAALGAGLASLISPNIANAAADAGSAMAGQGIWAGVLTALGIGTAGALAMAVKFKKNLSREEVWNRLNNEYFIPDFNDCIAGIIADPPPDDSFVNKWDFLLKIASHPKFDGDLNAILEELYPEGMTLPSEIEPSEFYTDLMELIQRLDGNGDFETLIRWVQRMDDPDYIASALGFFAQSQYPGPFEPVLDMLNRLDAHPDIVVESIGLIGFSPNFKGDYKSLIQKIEAKGAHPNRLAEALGRIGANPNFKGDFDQLLEKIERSGADAHELVDAWGRIGSNPNFSGDFYSYIQKFSEKASAYLAHPPEFPPPFLWVQLPRDENKVVFAALSDISGNPNFHGPFGPLVDLAAKLSAEYLPWAVGTIASGPNFNGDFSRLIDLAVGSNKTAWVVGKIGSNPHFNGDFGQLIEVVTRSGFRDADIVGALGEIGSNPNFNGDFGRLIQLVKRPSKDYWDKEPDALGKIASNPNFSGEYFEWLATLGQFAQNQSSIHSALKRVFSRRPGWVGLLPLVTHFDQLFREDLQAHFIAQFFAEAATQLEKTNQWDEALDAIVTAFEHPNAKIRKAFVEMGPFIAQNKDYSTVVRDAFTALTQSSRNDPDPGVRDAAAQAAKKIPDTHNKKGGPGGGPLLAALAAGLGALLSPDIVNAAVDIGQAIAGQGPWAGILAALGIGTAGALAMAVKGGGKKDLLKKAERDLEVLDDLIFQAELGETEVQRDLQELRVEHIADQASKGGLLAFRLLQRLSAYYDNGQAREAIRDMNLDHWIHGPKNAERITLLIDAAFWGNETAQWTLILERGSDPVIDKFFELLPNDQSPHGEQIQEKIALLDHYQGQDPTAERPAISEVEAAELMPVIIESNIRLGLQGSPEAIALLLEMREDPRLLQALRDTEVEDLEAALHGNLHAWAILQTLAEAGNTKALEIVQRHNKRGGFGGN